MNLERRRSAVQDNLMQYAVETNYIKVSVLKAAREMEVVVQFPAFLSDLSMMHRIWLQKIGPGHMEKYHSNFTGFESALKQFRDHSSCTVESKDRLALQCFVQTNIFEKHNFGSR